MSSVATENSSYAQGYAAWLRHEKQYSPLTAESYACDLRHLFELSADTPLANLKIHHIRRYVAQLHGKGLSGRSLARMLSINRVGLDLTRQVIRWPCFFRVLTSQ